MPQVILRYGRRRPRERSQLQRADFFGAWGVEQPARKHKRDTPREHSRPYTLALDGYPLSTCGRGLPCRVAFTAQKNVGTRRHPCQDHST